MHGWFLNLSNLELYSSRRRILSVSARYFFSLAEHRASGFLQALPLQIHERTSESLPFKLSFTGGGPRREIFRTRFYIARLEGEPTFFSDLPKPRSRAEIAEMDGRSSFFLPQEEYWTWSQRASL